MSRSVASNIQGISAKTLESGHGSHTTMKRPKPYTTPARNAPAKRIFNARPSRKVPMAAVRTFSTAMTLSDHQNGSTYAGRLNGEKIADCMSPR